MSVNDPIVLAWNPKHEHFYLTRGRETFYDDEDYMRTWDNAANAIRWAITHLDVSNIQLPALNDPWPAE